MSIPSTSVEVFYSFADSDAQLLQQLERHLSILWREGKITTWHKGKIVPGTNWQMELDQHLNTASLILLLISPAFFESDHCYDVEMQRAMQRHDEGEARVIPLLLRPIAGWQHASFGKLKALPSNGKPITEWSNRDTALADIVQGISAALDDVQHLPPSSTLSGVWNVPYRRNPHFIGRDELLDQLDRHFTPTGQHDPITTRRAALTQPRAIKGLGGIGKTQVAVEYAYRSRNLDRYAHTLWINAASEETIIASFVTLAELLLGFPTKNETDQRKLMEAVKHWLEQCEQRWLLIFDNADDLPIVQQHLPQRGKGDILLTTRAHAISSLAVSIEVEKMGLMEGTQLLLHRAGRDSRASDEEINEATNIVIALDSFPLALDQAGAYIEETQCRLVDYLQIYQTHQIQLLAKRGLQTTNYPDSVATTWSLSFQKVEQANPAVAELLCLCAFLAPDMIPEELIRDAAAQWSPLLQQAATDRFAFNQMIAELLKFSLVRRVVETQALSIHRLVQAVQKDMMGPDVQCQWAEKVLRAVNEVFPSDPREIATWSQCLRYLDQAQACHMLIEQYALQIVEAVYLLNRTNMYLQSHALYTMAEPLVKHALEISEQLLGPEHRDTSVCLSNLAFLYKAQRKYTQAEPLYQRALAIREQQLGAMHPDTARSLNNLALIYQYQEKYTQAEPLYQRALAINEQMLGAMHPTTRIVHKNYVTLLQTMGRDVK